VPPPAQGEQANHHGILRIAEFVAGRGYEPPSVWRGATRLSVTSEEAAAKR
jgi:hypothetical protein